jgi:hypothetical protein
VTVEVNWKRLKATHRELGGQDALILQLLPDQSTTADVLDQALVNDPYPTNESPANAGWFPGPKGWLLLLETQVDQMLWDWIGDLAQRLTDTGISGRLTGARNAGRVAWAQPFEDPPANETVGDIRLYGLLAYQPLPSETMYGKGWAAEPDTLDQVLDHTLAWALADADLAHVSMGQVSIGVPPGHARNLFRREITTDYVTSIDVYSRAHNRARRISFHIPAVVDVHQARLDPDPWETIVAELRHVITTAPRDTVALARVNFEGSLLHGSSDPIHGHYSHAFDLYPELFGEWSPDPCPIQILTNTHLAKAHDLSDWNLTRLDPGHTLVEAKDLTPWFTTFGPNGFLNRAGYHFPPDLLAKARHDFGDMILTRQTAEQLGLTTRPKPRP